MLTAIFIESPSDRAHRSVRAHIRRPSNRSSVTSVGTYLATPPEERPSTQYSSRSSYGFPAPPPPPPSTDATPYPPPSRGANHPDYRPITQLRQPSVLSWPQMEPAMEIMPEKMENYHTDRAIFTREYTMGSPGKEWAETGVTRLSSFGHGRSLPPLRMAISRGDSLYSP